jgi:uncharacterized membrane protein
MSLHVFAVGGGAGAALGRATGHAASVMTRDDLKALGEVLDEGDAGLVVVYGSDMADRVITSVRRARRTVRRSADVSLPELAAQVRAAQASEPLVSTQ